MKKFWFSRFLCWLKRGHKWRYMASTKEVFCIHCGVVRKDYREGHPDSGGKQ